MRIAILILAHKNLQQLDKLLVRLTKDFDVYLHLDKKWKIELSHFEKFSNVFITERYSINWGSYQQVQADVALFKMAFQKDYDYYLLVSGQDIPIKSNQQIINFLSANERYSFVDYEVFPKNKWIKDFQGGYSRVIYYYGFDFKKNAFGFILKKAMAFVRYLQKKTGSKRKLQPLCYYGGWNWVNLNRAAMTHIVNYLNDNPSFLKSFRYTLCGDEIWIQTVLLNSDNEVINNELRFTDWQDCIENPKTLTITHLDEIKKSKALFARKFDDAVDNEIIEAVYNMTGEHGQSSVPGMLV